MTPCLRAIALIRRVLPKGELGQGLLALGGGAAIGQIAVIASSPILTRLYSPAEVGAYAAAISILSVLLTVTCLRYEFAIPLPPGDLVAANLLALSSLTTLAMSLATALAVWLVGAPVLALLGTSVLTPYMWLLAVGQFGGGLLNAFTGWALRKRAYPDIAGTRVIQSFILVATQVALGIGGIGATGLLLGDVAGRIAGPVQLARALWRSHTSTFRGVSRAGVVGAARRYRRFPIFSSWSALLNAVGAVAPLLFLVASYGAGPGGHFAVAQRIIALPAAIVASAVAQIFFVEAARLRRDKPGELARLFGRTTRGLALAAIGPFAFGAALAPIVAEPIFGQGWYQAGLFTAILAPMYYLQLVTSPTGGTLDVLERQELALARELLRLCLLGGAFVIAATAHLSAIQTVGLLSFVGSLIYLLYGLLSWRAIIANRTTPRLASDTGRDISE